MNPLLSTRKCSEFFCGFVTAVFAVYALVITISAFSISSSSSTASTCCCSAAPPPAPAPSDGCNTDKMRRLVAILVWCLASAQTCSLVLIFFARSIMEGAREAHDRVAKDEDAAYSAACDAHKEASSRLLKLRRKLDDCSEGVRQRLEDDELWAALVTEQREEKKLMAEVELARQEAERKKPKEGMERITGRWGKAARISFLLSVIFSKLAAVIAGFAIYYSLQIQENCKFGGFFDILAFALAFGFSLPLHGFFAWVSITQR